MRKYIAPLIISILLLFQSFAFAVPYAPNATVALLEISDLGNNTMIVSPESDYTTIALAMAAATSGDTILVVEGTYDEAVVFSQDDLTLKSLGSASNTTITQATGSTVSFGTKSGCVLYGFTVALTAATAAGDEAIYSNNDSATDFNTVENCIITATNNAANTFALTMLNIDDGGIKFLYNAMHITQSNDHACYAMQNTAAHISHYRDNNLTITQGTTANHGSYGFNHNAATSTMHCMNNIIDFDAAHLTTGVAYMIYASAVENYVSGNEINAVTTGSGALYVLFTGGTDTAWYTGNQIYATTGDSDAEWANLTTGTTYAAGNNISGDGASTTGGTVYEGGNVINGVVTIVAGDISADSISSTHINWAEPITIPFDNKLQFGDTGIYIFADDDGILDIVADTSVDISNLLLATDADFGDLDITSADRISGVDAGTFIDFGATAQMEISCDGAGTPYSTPDIDITGTVYFDADMGLPVDTKVYFADTSTEFIESDDAGYVDIDANTGIRLNKDTTIAGTLSLTPTATPNVSGFDSDQSNDQTWQVIGDSDGTDGHMALKTQIADAMVEFIRLSGQDEKIVVSKPIQLDDNTSLSIEGGADAMDDHEHNGILVESLDAGEAIAIFETVFIANDTDPIKLASGTQASGLYPAFGIAVAAASDTAPVKILVRGIIRDETWAGLTPGAPIYLGETGNETLGGMVTVTPPATANDCVQIIGWAVSASEIYFDFSRPYQLVE